MDSTILSTRHNREELAKHVHRPTFKQVQYQKPDYYNQSFSSGCKLPSHNFMVLQEVVDGMDIENDPWIKHTRARLARLPPGPSRNTLDQKLSKKLAKQDTSTHRGLRDFRNAAAAICAEIGPWAADWYVAKVIEKAKLHGGPFQHVVRLWQDTEKHYLLEALEKVSVSIIPVSYDPADICAGCNDRPNVLIEALMNEKMDFENTDMEFSGIVFVTRRDVVIALAEVLQHHPFTKDTFYVGSLLGNSSDSRRTSFLDITRSINPQGTADTLADFKLGHKNLIISTSVAEEGIDVQSCCSVIRWDPPQNMISWAQSRGRARKRKSTFVIMTEVGTDPSVLRWEDLENKMVELYNDQSRDFQEEMEEEDDSDEEGIAFRVEKTGYVFCLITTAWGSYCVFDRATLTLHSAVSHLNHFCAVMPSAGYGSCLPVFETDPPEYPENWHAAPYRTTGTIPVAEGPFGATVRLPRHLPHELREFTTPRIHLSKTSAKRRVAFEAYKALYQFRGDKLLNDNLLPLSHIGEDMEALFAAGIEKRKGFSVAAVQMNPWSSESDELRWWAFKLTIDKLKDMVLIVRRELPNLLDEELPVLYIPGRGEVRVNVEPLGKVDDFNLKLEDARQFTRRLLWRVPGSRSTLGWAKTDFEYLLHPFGEDKDPVWDERWRWASKNTDGPPDDALLSLDLFGRKFDYPSDITYVQVSRKRGDYRFVRWRNEPLSEKEEERIRRDYANRKVLDLEITYPLLEVHDRGRKDLTIPFLGENKKVTSDVHHHRETELLVASHTRLFLASPDHSRWAGVLPSLLRQMSMIYTVISFRDTLLVSTPLYDIPLKHLTTALTAPAATAPTDYERMETLGDTVLKLLTCIQTMADHPFWHEGYLTARKDHVVANVSLARAATEMGVPRWIIRDRFVPTKWLPLLHQTDEAPEEEDVEGEEENKEGKQKVDLSTKTIADVVEALIGASYVHGSFDLGMDCIKLFGLGMEWKPIGESVEKIFTMVEALDDAELPMAMILSVEKILGYKFRKKTLVVEALTHPSYSLGVQTRPYDRLEFLGDAVLDMVVSHFLYYADGKNYSPGQMYLRRVAVVNQHFLAFICLDAYTTTDAFMGRTLDNETAVLEREENTVYLWQCLLQSNSHVMEDMAVTRARYEKGKETIKKALKEGRIHPWAALTALQAPKFFSDIIESLLGAVYLDSRGDMGIIRKVLEKLNVLPVLERIVREEVDVLHPVSRLAQWASKAKPQKLVKYRFEIAEKRIKCTIGMKDKPEKFNAEKAEATSADLDKELETIAVAEAEYRGHGSNEEVKFEAAERAIQKLEIREIRSLEDAKMDIVTQ